MKRGERKPGDSNSSPLYALEPYEFTRRHPLGSSINRGKLIAPLLFDLLQ
jgi:hypothetical protein